MSVFSENIGIKIQDVHRLVWEECRISVAARPFNALVFRVDGSADFSCGAATAKTRRGDVFFMPAGCGYTADYKEANTVTAIHFISDIKAEPENYHFENPHIMSALYGEIYDVWSKKETGYYYRALSVMGEILEKLALLGTYETKSDARKAFETAVEYMENNYLSPDFSVEKMISKAHMSYTYFRKLFIEKFGVTPSKHITAKRLVYAEKLLSTGKYSVERTAEMSGFGDAKYFCRVVKKNYGCAPSKLYKVWK